MCTTLFQASSRNAWLLCSLLGRVGRVWLGAAKADPKERLDTWQRVARAMRNFFTDSHVKFDNSVHVYMIDRYIVLLSVFACLLVLVLACSFSFPFPGVLENRFVDSGRWAYRFRIITAMGFNCPLVRHHPPSFVL